MATILVCNFHLYALLSLNCRNKILQCWRKRLSFLRRTMWDFNFMTLFCLNFWISQKTKGCHHVKRKYLGTTTWMNFALHVYLNVGQCHGVSGVNPKCYLNPKSGVSTYTYTHCVVTWELHYLSSVNLIRETRHFYNKCSLKIYDFCSCP